MDSLSDFGCFAYYFNSLILLNGIYPEYFVHFPQINTLLIIFGGGLSLLASKLLLRTINLHFTEIVGTEGMERLLERDPEKRSSVLNLPALLQRCLSFTCWGTTLYVVFMVVIVIALARESLANLYSFMDAGKEVGWGGLMVLGIVGILVGSSLSLQSMEGVQMACILLNVVFRLCYNLNFQADLSDSTSSPWQVISEIYNPCPLSHHLLIPSVLAASRATSKRHLVLLSWAMGLVLIINLPYELFFAYYKPLISGEINSDVRKIRRSLAGMVYFSCSHIYMRALADVVIAWRYGLNVKVAKLRYPLRIKIVQLLIPLIIYLPLMISICFCQEVALNIVYLPFGYAQAVSSVYFLIPYCYNCTVQEMGEELVGRVSVWWTYLLYAAGLCFLVHTIVWDILNHTVEKILLSLGINLGLFALMAIWQTIGYFIS